MAEKRTGADAVVSSLHACGVDVWFANPGTTEMWLVGALDRTEGVRAVLGCHETVCAGAADGYARMKRVPAAVLLHLGPGLANGSANLHNARRARVPVVVIVGDMATWHRGADAPLEMDIKAIANTFSKWVMSSDGIGDAAADAVEAVRQTRYAEDVSGGKVATLILPHDRSWEECKQVTCNVYDEPAPFELSETEADEFAKSCAEELKKYRNGQAIIFAGGEALLKDNGVLQNLGKIAAKTGAVLMCENAFARLDRGNGLPVMRRLPYFPQEAARELSKFSFVITVDVKLPVATFGYKDGPSMLVNLDEDKIWEFDASFDLPTIIGKLAAHCDADSIVPGRNCGGLFCVNPSRPPLPSGKLNAVSMCATLAHYQPADAILIDESLTSGTAYWEYSKHCPSFSHITLTGGAIGQGPPAAVGAAIACPDRKVINFQADGSCLYSTQAFWTQGRENLDVLTIICANNTYAILKLELARQGIQGGGKASQSLTDLTPPIDWVSLAKGYGVEGCKVTTVEEFADALQDALRVRGPRLIAAMLS